MADTKTQEPAPAAVPTQDAAPTLPADAPIDATPVPPAAVSEPTKVTETPLAPAVAVVPVAVPEVTSAPAKVEAPEPQNPLTEKFTEAEWKALKELRVCSHRICCYFSLSARRRIQAQAVCSSCIDILLYSQNLQISYPKCTKTRIGYLQVLTVK